MNLHSLNFYKKAISSLDNFSPREKIHIFQKLDSLLEKDTLSGHSDVKLIAPSYGLYSIRIASSIRVLAVIEKSNGAVVLDIFRKITSVANNIDEAIDFVSKHVSPTEFDKYTSEINTPESYTEHDNLYKRFASLIIPNSSEEIWPFINTWISIAMLVLHIHSVDDCPDIREVNISISEENEILTEDPNEIVEKDSFITKDKSEEIRPSEQSLLTDE